MLATIIPIGAGDDRQAAAWYSPEQDPGMRKIVTANVALIMTGSLWLGQSAWALDNTESARIKAARG